MANTSIYAAFERMWQHITAALEEKVTKVEGKGLSTNDYTTEEKDKLASLTAFEEITIADITEICSATIYSESEVTY